MRTSHEQPEQSDFQPCRYTILGLKDIDLGYAGRKSPNNPVHPALAALQPCSPLTLCSQGNRLLLLSANRPVAALSKAASTHWTDRTKDIISIQVVAMIRRSAREGDPAYKPLYHTDQWEVPLVEIAHRV